MSHRESRIDDGAQDAPRRICGESQHEFFDFVITV